MTENEIKALHWMRSIKNDTLLVSEPSIETLEKQFGNIETFIRDEININAEVIEQSLEELDKYRSIGTIEECKEAMKRQQARSPKRKVQNEDLKIGCVTFKAGTKTYWCPNCKKAITGSDHYCRWCGQTISWQADD